jgi:hypothetical protein
MHIIISLAILAFVLFIQYKYYRETKKDIQSLGDFIDHQNLDIDEEEIIIPETNEEEVISVIEYKNKDNKEMGSVVSSINKYLISNRGSISDFNIIRDMVDRNIEVVENRIQNKISLPLYIGLLGTMVSIVVGLFFYNTVSDTDLQIQYLIQSVGIA